VGQTARSQLVNQDDKCQWPEVEPLRHTSHQLQPVRQDVTDLDTDLDTLTSMTQEGADPPDNDVRQTQRNQIGYENVVVDVIKCLSEVDEDSAYRLALVDSSVPVWRQWRVSLNVA